MQSNIFKIHHPRRENNNLHMKKKTKNIDSSTFAQPNNKDQYWHEDLFLFRIDEKILMDNNTSWLESQHIDASMKVLFETKLQHQSWLESQHIDVAMKVLFETKLQHRGYESHQYSIYYGRRTFENKCFAISTHKYEPFNFSNIKPFTHIYAMYFV